MRFPALLALACLALACGGSGDEGTLLRISGSAVGAEGEILARQIVRFQAGTPGVHVEIQSTPDDATQRHQLGPLPGERRPRLSAAASSRSMRTAVFPMRPGA